MEMDAEESELSLKDASVLYKLIISQLLYDGFRKLAKELSVLYQPDLPLTATPSDRLRRLVHQALHKGFRVDFKGQEGENAVTVVRERRKPTEFVDSDPEEDNFEVTPVAVEENKYSTNAQVTNLDRPGQGEASGLATAQTFGPSAVQAISVEPCDVKQEDKASDSPCDVLPLPTPLLISMLRSGNTRHTRKLADPISSHGQINSFPSPSTTGQGHVLTTGVDNVRQGSAENPWRCDLCNQMYSSLRHLRKHLLIHLEGKPCKCDQCGKAFTARGSLCDHYRKVHLKDTTYACDICNKVYMKSSHLARHKFKHTGERPHKCELCGKGFVGEYQLRAHFRGHTGERPFGCRICGKTFGHKHNLAHHEKTHAHKEKPSGPAIQIKCPHCHRQLFSKTNLEVHLRTCKVLHPPSPVFLQCEVCDAICRSKSAFEAHKRTHTKPYSCEECGKAFSQSTKVRDHMRTHTGEKPYKCQVCGKSFAMLSSLWKHKEIHDKDRKKPHKCPVCSMTFAVPAGLRIHLYTHKVKGPNEDKSSEGHWCKVCGKGFLRKFALKAHLQSHSTDRPHQCEECGLSFKWMNNLRRHIARHKGLEREDNPHRCDFCGKGFTCVTDLMAHRRIHTGEKPFQCDKCGMSFTQKSRVKTHRCDRRVKPYKCDLCGKASIHLRALQIHRRRKHGIKLKDLPKAEQDLYRCSTTRSAIINQVSDGGAVVPTSNNVKSETNPTVVPLHQPAVPVITHANVAPAPVNYQVYITRDTAHVLGVPPSSNGRVHDMDMGV